MAQLVRLPVIKYFQTRLVKIQATLKIYFNTISSIGHPSQMSDISILNIDQDCYARELLDKQSKCNVMCFIKFSLFLQAFSKLSHFLRAIPHMNIWKDGRHFYQ